MRKLSNPLSVGVGTLVMLTLLFGTVGCGSGSGGGFATFNAENTIVAHEDGLRVAVEPSQMTDGFGVRLESTAPGAFLTISGEGLLADARRVLPGYVVPAGAVFTVESNGPVPGLMALAVRLPDGVTDAMPYDVFGYFDGQWKHMPSWQVDREIVARVSELPDVVALMQYQPGVPLASTTLELNEALGEVASAINVVSPAGINLQSNGTLSGAVAGGFALGQGYAVMPLVRGDGAALNAMLADATARQNQIAGLVDFATNGNYDGVVLDYQGLDENRSTAFTQFVQDLATEFHLRNKQLVIVMPTPAGSAPTYFTGGYDLPRLGQAADALEVRLSNDPTSVGDGRMSAMLSWLVHNVDRTKLRLRVSTYSVELSQNGAVRLPYSQALARLGQTALLSDVSGLQAGNVLEFGLSGQATTLDYDENAYSLRYDYVALEGDTRTVFIAHPQKLGQQLQLASAFFIGGVSVEGLFNADNPPGMVDTLVQYKVGGLAPVASLPTDLRFVISDGSGVLNETVVPVGERLTWQPGAEGAYQVTATLGELQLGGLSVQVGPAQVAEVPTAAVTPTAAPPTRTPGPTPTIDPNAPTPTPRPTNAPAPTATTVAPPVTGGGAWGAFELGGQVTDGGAPSVFGEYLRRAGMTWVKVQATSLGQNMTDAINVAHGNGFKILITFIDFGQKDLANDPGYQQQAAAYMASLAAAGADAVEVWNEPNIEREWPAGQISGANYANMLRVAYPAIKAANPNTIVISGAPAPTGFWGGGCGVNGCDDAIFMQQLFDAGGANYMDCIGIHYNEGIISPREIGTDPRDNHYTRYYQTMVNTYANIFKNSRPLCFTELGYLSGEGYPDLASTAPGFAWAANTTVAQHAQWLAEAASLAKSSGAVRLMIVFNMNYTRYDSDPQAGYAIIRPGGGCPACDALGAVMP